MTDSRTKHGLSRTQEYRAWQQMRLRCLNPEHHNYPDYGGRGITVCDEWRHDPRPFFEHIGPKPTPQHELDRIDNDRGYEPGNVRWVTREVNSRNRRSNRWIECNGISKTVAEWVKMTGIPEYTIRRRIDSGWSPESAITTPSRVQVNTPAKLGVRKKKR